MKKQQSIYIGGKRLDKAGMQKVKGGYGPGIWVCIDEFRCFRQKADCLRYCQAPYICKLFSQCP